MPDLSTNNSFIPKQGPAVKRKKTATSRPVYVFTIISYVLLFATLIATAGVFFYSEVVDRQLKTAITEFNTEISSFNEADMQRVLEFDLRLSQAADRLNNSVSVASIFSALEDATIDTVQITSLDLQRQDDELFELAALISTNSFDSTLFQRGVFQRNQAITAVEVTALQNIRNIGVDSEQDTNNDTPLVTFAANLIVPVSSVPYTGSEIESVEEPLTITPDQEAEETGEEEDAEEGVSETEVSEGNNQNI